MTVTLQLSEKSADVSVRRSLTNVALAVAKSKRIVVVTGAGISCSCGIPDFRSNDGLYNLVKQQYPDVVLKGRDLFDASLFRDSTSTSVFYTFISKLKQSIDTVSPSPTHHFIKTLDGKGKLLRSYTQNIDGLEERVGMLCTSSEEAQNTGKGKSKLRMKEVKNVQLHGDIHRVRCTLCSADFAFTQEHADIFDTGYPPDCPECVCRSEARTARSARALKIGTLRPAIVLYDEPHPLGDDIGNIETRDLSRKPDLLIVMGTSLKVHGIKKLVKEFAKEIHSRPPRDAKKGTSSKMPQECRVIFVNKTPPSSEWDNIVDYFIEGETDEWSEYVVEEWRKNRPADWEIQTTLVANGENTGALSVVKNSMGKTAKKGEIKKPRMVPVVEIENVPPPMYHTTHGKSMSTTSLVSITNNAIPDCTTVMPPPSPSKRRHKTSHYSSLQCSPPKRRTRAAKVGAETVMPPEERGLLFGVRRNENVVDLISP